MSVINPVAGLPAEDRHGLVPPGACLGLVLLTLVLGLVYLALTPPFQVPDEPHHFLRAWQISEGQVWGEVRQGKAGGQIPPGIGQDVARFNPLAGAPQARISREVLLREYRRSTEWTSENVTARAFTPFSNTVLYAPVPYLPQALGLWLARQWGLHTVAALYLGRLLSLLASVSLLGAAFCLCAFSWRLVFLLFLLATLPMSLFLWGALSADAMTIALAFLNLALSLRLLRQWNFAGFVSLLICSLWLGLCKGFYVLIPLAGIPAIMLAEEKITTKIAGAFLLAAVSLGPALAWSWSVTALYTPGRTDIAIDPVGQFHFVLRQPGAFFAAWITTLRQHWNGFYTSCIGILGWLDTPLPRVVYRGSAVLLGVTLLIGRQPRPPEVWPPWWSAIMAGLIFLTSTLLLALACYLSWTPVGAPQVEGIQGRYFLPLAPLALLWWPPAWYVRPSTYRLIQVTAGLGWLYLAVVSAAALYQRYWGAGGALPGAWE